jgi:hypothetical protein
MQRASSIAIYRSTGDTRVSGIDVVEHPICCATLPVVGGHQRNRSLPTLHAAATAESRYLFRIRPNEAAQESNLPTDGLHRPAGFQDSR